MDVSSHQPSDLSALIAAHQIEHVIVKLYQTREVIPQRLIAQDWSRMQIASAQANKCTVGGYVWLYKAWPGALQARDAILLAQKCNVILPHLDIDFEPYTDGTMPTVDQLRQAIGQCRYLGIAPRIYVAKWVTDQYGLDLSEFAADGVPLWAAQYDGIADPDVFTPFGGYTRCEVKQYQTDPVDLDIMRREVTV